MNWAEEKIAVKPIDDGKGMGPIKLNLNLQ